MAKNKTENRVLFIDASKEFKKETNNNILEEKNINTIIEEFRNREEKEDTREIIDIKVLNQEIEETVRKIDSLRASINEIIKKLEEEGES